MNHAPDTSSWQPPPSVVNDSMPNNDLTLPQFCSPTRILEYYLSGLESSQPSRLPCTPASAAPQTSSPKDFIPQSPEMGLKASLANSGNARIVG